MNKKRDGRVFGIRFFCMLILSALALTANAENQLWWGHTNNIDQRGSYGTQQTGTYHCAVFIPGDNAATSGKKIAAIRFSLKANNVTDIKAWTATALPDPADESQLSVSVDVDPSQIGPTDTELPLPSPCDIPAEGIYVGYSFTITTAKRGPDMFPVITAPATTEGSLFVQTEQSDGWEDLYSQGKGGLMLQILLQGDFADRHALPGELTPMMVSVGGESTTVLPLTNIGTQSVSSIDYTVSDDYTTSGERHADLTDPIAFGETKSIPIIIPADDTQRKSMKTLTVTKVNGQPNSRPGSTAELMCYSIADVINRNVVVEEYTGVQCGNCPRGMVGMSMLHDMYGSRFVGIAIHQYSKNDAMYISPDNYAPLSFQEAPMCTFDRSWMVDPFYGSMEMGEHRVWDDFPVALQELTRCSVSVSGSIDDDFSQVEAVAQIKSLFDDSYSLEFVLVADGLTGSANNWLQSNFLYSIEPEIVPEELWPFAKGGTYGLSRISGLAYNDVAVASSYVEGKNQVEDVTVTAGDVKEVSYTLPLPATELKEALRAGRLYVIALVVDAQGRILNADKQPVSGSGATAVSTIATTHDTSATVYTPDGLCHPRLQPGLNIVRTPSGNITKIFVSNP